MSSKKKRLDKLCEDLQLDFKSVVANEEAKCLVRFHNCTKYNVMLYWIDFNGWPIRYPTLRSRESIVIDTYASHLWFFRALVREEGEERSMQMKKVQAISSESLDSQCNATNYSYEPIVNGNDIIFRRDSAVCPLCRHIMRTYSKKPVASPCHHYSGQARLASTDLSGRSHSNFNSPGAYIYTCSENTHLKEHSLRRRDFYLVESFYNLRERCFMKMDYDVRGEEEIVDLNLPTSIIREYIQFTSALRKLNEKS